MSSPPSNIVDLTAGLRRGEDDAFRELYDRYGLFLLRYLTALHQGNLEAAKDSLQSVFMRIARHIRVYEDEVVFEGWLKRVARTTFIDSQRKSSRYQRLLERFAQSFEESEVASDAPLAELRPSLIRALAALPPEARSLVEARYFDQLSLTEIAQRHGLTARAVEGRLARIRATLRQTIQQGSANV